MKHKKIRIRETQKRHETEGRDRGKSEHMYYNSSCIFLVYYYAAIMDETNWHLMVAILINNDKNKIIPTQILVLCSEQIKAWRTGKWGTSAWRSLIEEIGRMRGPPLCYSDE